MEHIVIIGNGIAGVTAARHIRKISGLPKHNKGRKITIISGESEHFWSRTALMYIYMGHLTYNHTKPYEDWFWKKNAIDLIKDWVVDIDFEAKNCYLKENEAVPYDKLILATGSQTEYHNWPGQESRGVVGMVSLQDLENIEHYAPNNSTCKKAVIVGGGLIGVEMAEMLTTRKIPVTFLVREGGFWSSVLPLRSAKMISRHMENHGIDLRHHEELEHITAGEDGKITEVKTNSGERIPCDFLGICTGVKPQIKWLENLNIDTDKGILVNRYLETSQDGVFAIGDCAQQRQPVAKRKAVEAVWYTGRMMGETLAQTICGSPTKWKPGLWFNSAKFFDIEFQTYGRVWNQPADDHAHFHWENTQGTRALDIEFNKTTSAIAGVNTFGIRMKHGVWEKWIAEKKTLDFAIDHLKASCFDPEFNKTPIKQIQENFYHSVED